MTRGGKLLQQYAIHVLLTSLCISEDAFTGALLLCTVMYCTVLYCTARYCTVLYCTVSFSSFSPDEGDHNSFHANDTVTRIPLKFHHSSLIMHTSPSRLAYHYPILSFQEALMSAVGSTLSTSKREALVRYSIA